MLQTPTRRVIEFEEALLELPRTAGVKLSDVELTEADFKLLPDLVAAGDPEALKTARVLKNVLFELMWRTPAPGDVNLRDPNGNPLPKERIQVVASEKPRTHRGGLRSICKPDGTAKRITDENGRVKVLAKESSRWAVAEEDCACVNDTDSAPRPKRGQIKLDIDTYFEQAILPHLRFCSDDGDPGLVAGSKGFNPDEFRAKWKEASSDKSLKRKSLLSWLPAFIKAGATSAWTGEE